MGLKRLVYFIVEDHSLAKNYPGWPRRSLHSPRTERIRENMPVTPMA